MFAVGVTSGAVRSELETIGSEPSCIHVFMLESFADMDHFKAQLEKQACSGELPSLCQLFLNKPSFILSFVCF